MKYEQTIRITNPKKGFSTDGTWAQYTKKNSLLFISGQVSLNNKGEIVGKGDFEIQAKQTLDNLMSMLEEGGGKPEDLMLINVYITNMKYRPIFAKIREAYFRKNPPASTIVEVNRLFMDDLLIEINGIAIL